MRVSTDMHRRPFIRIVVIALVISVVVVVLPVSRSGAQNAPAPYTMQSEQIGPAQLVVAALYRPTSTTPNESIALIVVHQIPVGAELPCPQLAQRGFTVVCTDETGTTLDQLAQGIGYGVSYARSLPGIHHVVLLGWSGGGSMVAYYQNVAENGVAVCQAPERLDPCSNALAKLPRADGVVFLDAIPGLAFSFMSALDPAVATPEGLTGQLEPPSLSSASETATTRIPMSRRRTPRRSSAGIRRHRVIARPTWSALLKDLRKRPPRVVGLPMKRHFEWDTTPLASGSRTRAFLLTPKTRIR